MATKAEGEREDLSNWNMSSITSVKFLPSFTKEYFDAVKPIFSSNISTWTFTLSDETDDEILASIVPYNIDEYKIISEGSLRSITKINVAIY